jgi:hypothetical protein
MSALQAVKVREHARHGLLVEGRRGAGDENTGSDFAGDGEEDHVVAGGGDYDLVELKAFVSAALTVCRYCGAKTDSPKFR